MGAGGFIYRGKGRKEGEERGLGIGILIRSRPGAICMYVCRNGPIALGLLPQKVFTSFEIGCTLIKLKGLK